MAPEDDLQLLKNCLDGKPGAWEAFVTHLAPYLAEVSRRAMRAAGLPAGPQDVEDMLQELLLLLLKHNARALRLYRGGASVRGYLAAVAAHRVARQRVPPGPREIPERVAPEPGPAEEAQAREAAALLRAEMGRLPGRSRLALALQADGASLREIGEVLGVSEDAAAQILSRAREILRRRLES